jgi:two-component system, chemotaxis family, protein-glutamate methylesterase/glutaminase
MPGTIVVIGGSAGGIEALSGVVGLLRPDLPAAVLVVVHVAPTATSVLPQIVTRAGPLPARHVTDGDPIEPGVVAVCPPNRQLVVERGRLHLHQGPREHGIRPAIDPLLRSAAATAGPHTIGVVLSGVLDDGAAGLVAVKAAGGITVVQDPETAAYPDMPLAAISAVDVDHVAAPAEIGKLIGQLAVELADHAVPVNEELTPTVRGSKETDMEREHPDIYSCPACNGPLTTESDDKAVMRFRCRVGHVWSSRTLVAEQSQALEDALWTALRTLEDKAALSRRLSARAHTAGQDRVAENFAAHARDVEERAKVVRSVLEEIDVLTTDPASGTVVH